MNRNASCRKPIRAGLAFAAALAFAGPTLAEWMPDFPASAVVMADDRRAMASYPLPVGPWQAGAVATLAVEGQLHQQAWRLGAEGGTTLELMQRLRGDIVAAGYRILFECATEACGGFDFRYGTPVLPEPQMHVDLGDFRYLAAGRDGAAGKEYLSLLVSRSPRDAYVQMTRVGALAAPSADVTASTKAPAEAAAAATPGAALALSLPAAPELPAGDAMMAGLGLGLPVVLEDLVFASGSASLQAGDYASLTALAAWLMAHPQVRVMLVGHTDASGALAANTALSRRRAESVRQALIAQTGVAAAQVLAEGAGPLAPRASNDTADGRQKNRRVEVFVTPTR